ncbi:MAG: sigma-70 family RNA polymerase sigma factor [Gemmataceae bacterium]
MSQAAHVRPRRPGEEAIRFVIHPDFANREVTAAWNELWLEQADENEFGASHMPDDVTRDTAKRMHYAAYRASKARTLEESDRWRRRYYTCRDRVVLGNRKLVFGAVRKKLMETQSADDVVGDCYIVMIRAVAAYNPWLGIRFSTYAYTCLMRALSRMAHRTISDKLARHLSLDYIGEAEPMHLEEDESPTMQFGALEEYLDESHPLLSIREKTVLRRRFRFDDERRATLERVGQELGISKERVRQVQTIAIEKLRTVLVGAADA